MHEIASIAERSTNSSAVLDGGAAHKPSETDMELNERFPIQLKLSVGATNHPLEHEADAMADHVMRKPETSFIQRKSNCSCSEYDDEHIHLKPLSAQSKSGGGGTTVSNSVAGGINSTMGGGSSMDAGTKTFMENRFGADFGDVKIHDNNESADLNRSLNAKAFTVNNNIWFNSGQYQPGTDTGKHLLAHELTHTIQQGGAGNSVQRKSGAGITNFIQRIPINSNPPKSQTNHRKVTDPAYREIPQGPITRKDFDQYVMDNFGVGSVSDGTQKEQEDSLQKVNGPKPSIPNWQAWSPPDPSEDYSHIIRAIEDFAGVFASVPIIKSITFFKVAYDPGPQGVGIANGDVGASFGSGELTIFQAFSKSRAFPIARSNAAGNYPSVTIGLSSPGSNPGAPAQYQSRDKSLKENIVHELGHGVAEAASAADPKALDNFNAAVGWVGKHPEVLYDIGQPAVQAAIAKGTTPPAQYIIEDSHWNDPKWIEQPMSNYSVKGGSSEDFAESIAAYVYTKSVLASRSPARYNFIDKGWTGWIAKMRFMPSIIPKPPVGDFPVTDEIKHTA